MTGLGGMQQQVDTAVGLLVLLLKGLTFSFIVTYWLAAAAEVMH